MTLPAGSALMPAGAAGKNPASVEVNSDSSDIYAAQVLDLMNAQRRNAGVPALRWNQKVANVSQEWANHLGEATKDPNFDWGTIHRADGGGPAISAGATWYAEIIGFNFTPRNIVDWWMNSPSHRAAMLDGRETDAGVGYVVPASGPYAGWHLVVSNMAGYRSSGPAPVPAPAPASFFGDLSAGQPFLTEINWVADKKIATGWTEANGAKTYRPFDSVSREAMAAFMYRLAGSPAYTAPASSPFADVATGQQFYKEIAWLASRRISTGWTEADGTSTFRPQQPVERDVMAAFLYRLSGSPSYTAPKVSAFADVSSGQQFYKEIAWLSARGISSGWTEVNGTRTFKSVQSVNRDAMAAFMYRWVH